MQGLTEAQAARRLTLEGPNELPSTRRRGFLAMAYDVVREPMILLLVGCGGLYLLIPGPGHVQDALLLLSFVFVVMGITLYQNRKTERALEALRDLSSPRALVIRDGRQRRIAGREVVRGDLLLLVEGDRVPADALVLVSINLSADESLLTGESVPVRKMSAGDNRPPARPGGDDLPYVFSGTLITRGQGAAEVLATGAQTEMGKLGKALQSLEPQQTQLQKEIARLVRTVAIFGACFCAMVVLVYALSRQDQGGKAWLDGLLAGLTLAMAMLPEEFPVVLTIFLALGAWRMSQKRVLTRQVPAVESLGSATVLCVDKTGTLTTNQMIVRQLYAGGQSCDVAAQGGKDLPEAFHPLVEFAILASQRETFDPMDKAITRLGQYALSGSEHLHEDFRLVREYPLSQDLLALSHVWSSPDGGRYVIAAKGAPEAIADLCHFSPARTEELMRTISQMAQEGLRILGVARANFSRTDLPGRQHDFPFEFLGLVGLADPVRTNAPPAIAECYQAGIRVIMITGDYPGTARTVARQIGLESPDQVVTGAQLEAMDENQLADRLRQTNVCARMVPQQKLRLVQALQGRGEVVAMTGDGVNDAPALKAANIGIAMGQRGTDVAREAASLVLLDDDFSSIVAAVRQGRRIFDNLKKAMSYILAIHVPIAGLSLVPVLMGKAWPLILLPVHIVFLELIIDPACSVVFEAEGEEPDIMRRRPRNPKEPLFGRRLLWLSLLQGLSVMAITLAMFAFTYFVRRHSEDDARALTFTTLIVANLALILSNRSWSRTIFGNLRRGNSALWWVVGGAMVFLAAVLYVPPLQQLFHFSMLHPLDLVLCLAAGASGVVWFELLKLFWKGKRI